MSDELSDGIKKSMKIHLCNPLDTHNFLQKVVGVQLLAAKVPTEMLTETGETIELTDEQIDEWVQSYRNATEYVCPKRFMPRGSAIGVNIPETFKLELPFDERVPLIWEKIQEVYERFLLSVDPKTGKPKISNP